MYVLEVGKIYIISDQQFGFRKGISCVYAITSVNIAISKALN